MRKLLLWLFALVSATCARHSRRVPLLGNLSPLVTEFEWKYFDYVWNSPAQRDQYIRSGRYNISSMEPFDVDRSIDGRTFVTIRRDVRVPASVHTVSNKQGPSGPLLEPYPDWSWYDNSIGCNGITSVFRVAIDKCNRIWLLDTGVIGNDRVCPAKLLVFSLDTDRLLFEIKIPDEVARSKTKKEELNGLLVTPIVETYGETCDDTTVYMADLLGYAVVIWNNFRLFRIEDDVFRPEAKNSNFSIAGQSFVFDDGVLGMALSPIQYPGESRYLAFRPFASRSLYAVDTRDLKRSIDGTRIMYYKGIDVLPSQASAQAFSSEGTLFYGLASEIAIGCWNINRPLQKDYFKIAVQDSERLQFTSGMKVISNPVLSPNGEEYLLMMTNRLQKFVTQTLNFNEINFRILRAPVKTLIRNTVCDKY